MRRAPRPTVLCVGASLVLLACHTTLEPVRLARATCADIDISGVKYAICETPLDHAAAEQDCVERAGHLASLESSDEDQAVADAVFAQVSSSNVWLGGTRDDDLVWSWAGGGVFWRGEQSGMAETGAFVLWQAGEPNNTSSQGGGPEACLALTAEGADWNDRRCDLTLPYVCELD